MIKMIEREKTLKLKKEYSTIQKLISKNKLIKETKEAKELISKFKDAKSKGRFTKQLLFEIAKWKSHRRAYLCKLNRNRIVNKTFHELLFLSNEKDKMQRLRKLKGVQVPVASAVLTMTDPKNYGVIDFRVWQTLYLYGLVDDKPLGSSLSLTNWIQYLEIIRSLAKNNKMKARDIDRTLFEYHKSLEQRICK